MKHGRREENIAKRISNTLLSNSILGFLSDTLACFSTGARKEPRYIVVPLTCVAVRLHPCSFVVYSTLCFPPSANQKLYNSKNRSSSSGNSSSNSSINSSNSSSKYFVVVLIVVRSTSSCKVVSSSINSSSM